MKLIWIGIALLGAAALAVLALLAALIVRRVKSRRKVQRMTMERKAELLNELAKPLGFLYAAQQDVFTSDRDAWQRRMGYTAAFDRAAAAAHIVIDAQPVYFDYDGRTWLVELWKGQYGINTGGETGIYHAEGIVPPEIYKTAHFDAAEDFELPYMRSRLMKGTKVLYELGAEHWWLTGFVTGMFSKPGKLFQQTAITFNRRGMAEAFLRGLDRSGMDRRSYRICGNTVCVDFKACREKLPPAQRLCRAWAQFWNRFWTGCFLIVTAPFSSTADRMLFLYFQLPGCFRKALGHGGKRCGLRR